MILLGSKTMFNSQNNQQFGANMPSYIPALVLTTLILGCQTPATEVTQEISDRDCRNDGIGCAPSSEDQATQGVHRLHLDVAVPLRAPLPRALLAQRDPLAGAGPHEERRPPLPAGALTQYLQPGRARHRRGQSR